MKPTILVIDDNSFIRFMISSVLGLDFNILEASDSDSGWDLAKKSSPVLILLDILLPGSCDGLGLLRKIKEDSNLSNSPVIIMTGHSYIDAAESTRHGAVNYFTKPFSPYQLATAVKEAINAAC